MPRRRHEGHAGCAGSSAGLTRSSRTRHASAPVRRNRGQLLIPGLIPVMTPLTAAASVLGTPALPGLIPLLIGGGVVWSVMPAFLGLALAVLAAVKQRLRDRKG